MRGYIIEGPDGSGKTFTAEAIASAVNLPLSHSGGPPKSSFDIYTRAVTQATTTGMIFDRFVIITDKIYSPVIRGQHLFDDVWLKLIHLPVIYCRPSRETILSAELVAKSHKPQAHTDKVKARIHRIIDAYDELMKQISHIRFNRDTESLEDLCAGLASLKDELTLK